METTHPGVFSTAAQRAESPKTRWISVVLLDYRRGERPGNWWGKLAPHALFSEMTSFCQRLCTAVLSAKLFRCTAIQGRAGWVDGINHATPGDTAAKPCTFTQEGNTSSIFHMQRGGVQQTTAVRTSPTDRCSATPRTKVSRKQKRDASQNTATFDGWGDVGSRFEVGSVSEAKAAGRWKEMQAHRRRRRRVCSCSAGTRAAARDTHEGWLSFLSLFRMGRLTPRRSERNQTLTHRGHHQARRQHSRARRHHALRRCDVHRNRRRRYLLRQALEGHPPTLPNAL